MRQLCGRKDRKAAASQILDVHGDNLVMNSQEWLLQSLSEEKVQKSHKKKNDGPSTVEKRKHQITYLAHQVCIYVVLVFHCRFFIQISPQW